jgi:hypothetical protein
VHQQEIYSRFSLTSCVNPRAKNPEQQQQQRKKKNLSRRKMLACAEIIDDTNTCTACMVQHRETCLPCGHCLLCEVCMGNFLLRSQACPACRAPFTHYLVDSLFASAPHFIPSLAEFKCKRVEVKHITIEIPPHTFTFALNDEEVNALASLDPRCFNSKVSWTLIWVFIFLMIVSIVA